MSQGERRDERARREVGGCVVATPRPGLGRARRRTTRASRPAPATPTAFP